MGVKAGGGRGFVRVPFGAFVGRVRCGTRLRNVSILLGRRSCADGYSTLSLRPVRGRSVCLKGEVGENLFGASGGFLVGTSLGNSCGVKQGMFKGSFVGSGEKCMIRPFGMGLGGGWR